MDNLRNSEQQRLNNIQSAIRLADNNWRIRFPMLDHQNAIGMLFLLVSLGGMIASGLISITCSGLQTVGSVVPDISMTGRPQ